ncbi:MAG: hypothetical protein ACTSRP_05805 [Candidatus Helarchaeota archaeon]
MNNNEPLFIYFIPMVNEDNGEVIFSTAISEFEVNSNRSDTAVIIMPFEFASVHDERNKEEDHASSLVKLMVYTLIERFSKLLIFDKIIIFHNSMLDEYASILSEIVDEYYGKDTLIMDLIKISREFCKRMDDVNFIDKRMFDEIKKYHKKAGLVDLDETDELQKIVFDQLIKKRKIILEKKRRYKSRMNNIVLGYVEKTYELEAFQKWEDLKKKGKIIYYPPGILPIE